MGGGVTRSDSSLHTRGERGMPLRGGHHGDAEDTDIGSGERTGSLECGRAGGDDVVDDHPGVGSTSDDPVARHGERPSQIGRPTGGIEPSLVCHPPALTQDVAHTGIDSRLT